MLKKETPSTASNGKILQATRQDYQKLASFLNQNLKSHRHLDWIPPLEWIGIQPYLYQEINKQIQSVLCASPENSDSAWIRVFAVLKKLPIENHWEKLFPSATRLLRENHIDRLAALALHPWFEALLVSSGFSTRQSVVVLEWNGNFPPKERCNPDILIRPMTIHDLESVEKVDTSAFPSLWENSLLSLTKALKQTGISTVAVLNDRIVGYQISTTMTIYGHLARLAVLPGCQRQGIAYTLVYDLLKKFDHQGFWRVTVNTQSDNQPSLGLYQQFGFRPTKEEIKVYEYQL